jgi:hypothetical protein
VNKPIVINEGYVKKGGLNLPSTDYKPPAPSALKSERNLSSYYDTFDSSNIDLIHRDLADYGFARLRDQLFDAVRVLWRRRIEEGVTFDDIAKRIGRSKRWVKSKYQAPGEWTLRCAGELISALDGEAEITIFGLEDRVYTKKLGFGDSIEFNNEKFFVIGESISSNDACYVIVAANKDNTGMLINGDCCEIVGAGFHSYSRELQTKYLKEYPGNLKGI